MSPSYRAQHVIVVEDKEKTVRDKIADETISSNSRVISGHLFKRRQAYQLVVDAFRHYLTEPVNRAGLVLLIKSNR